MKKKGTNIVHTRYEYLPEFGTFLRVGDGLVGSSEFQQRKLFPFFQGYFSKYWNQTRAA